MALARDKLKILNKEKSIFSDATKHGDRFLYHINYVERTKDFVASHFGNDMSDKLFEITAVNDFWYGPFISLYGAHLVMIINNQVGRLPKVSEIQSRVAADYLIAEKKKQLEIVVKKIISGYDVQITL